MGSLQSVSQSVSLLLPPSTYDERRMLDSRGDGPLERRRRKEKFAQESGKERSRLRRTKSDEDGIGM